MTESEKEVREGADGNMEQSPTPHAQLALWVSALGFGVEGFDLLLLVLLLAPIASEFALTTTRKASLMSGTLFRRRSRRHRLWAACDYLGRARVLRWTILLFGLFTANTKSVSTLDFLILLKRLLQSFLYCLFLLMLWNHCRLFGLLVRLIAFPGKPAGPRDLIARTKLRTGPLHLQLRWAGDPG